jgi:hypothetical protein
VGFRWCYWCSGGRGRGDDDYTRSICTLIPHEFEEEDEEQMARQEQQQEQERRRERERSGDDRLNSLDLGPPGRRAWG